MAIAKDNFLVLLLYVTSLRTFTIFVMSVFMILYCFDESTICCVDLFVVDLILIVLADSVHLCQFIMAIVIVYR